MEENILESFLEFINYSHIEKDNDLGLVYYPSKKSIREAIEKSMA